MIGIDFLLEHNRYMSVVTLFLILGIAFLCSSAKKSIKFKLIVNALFMQSVLAFLILKTGIGKAIFAALARGVEGLYTFAGHGSEFVFGRLATISEPWGMVFAFKVLPAIIFFGALMAILFHLGIVQVLVKGMAILMRPILGISGAETLCITASSMLSQTEAPLLIKNYLAQMTDSEMFLIMVCGMAHLSGSLLAVYGSMGAPIEHLLTSSVIAIPGAIIIAKIMMPETGTPQTAQGDFKIEQAPTRNLLDAVSRGTSDGVGLATAVAAMLISIISLMAFVDYLCAHQVGAYLNTLFSTSFDFSLNGIFGALFYWVAYAIGVPFNECTAAGALLGKKLVINEFVAYASFAAQEFIPRTQIIMTYALSGFANFSSIGIQIGGIGAICPEKRVTLTRLGLKALLAGTLVNLFNATLVGLLI